jgi:hypothetical protein
MIRLFGRRSVALLTLALFTFTLFGCSGTKGDVTGTVTRKGKKWDLEGATICFIGETGEPKSFEIGSDGSFKATSLPVGEWKVSVSSTAGNTRANAAKPPRDQAPAESQKHPTKATDKDKQAQGANPIPERFRDPNTSGIKVMVEGGKSVTLNFDVVD